MISDWWTRWPAANIGGRVPDGLMVIDIDPRNGGLAGWASLTAKRTAPETLTVLSGREDGGSHLYFLRPPGPLSSRQLPPGIDLKVNGYCVLPPSRHPATGKPYRWLENTPAGLPPWLREVLRPPAVPRTLARRLGTSTAARHRLVDFVAQQPEGNRNDGLYWAANRAHEAGVLDSLEEELVEAATSAGETPTAARRTIASARGRAS